MRCDQARSSLYGGAGGWERVLVGLHLRRCANCRAEAKQIRGLDAALETLPRYAPSDGLLSRLLAISAATSATTETKEKHTMRRAVYVGIALAAIAALAVIALPGRGGKKDVRTILADVAQAMEQVTSMHQSGRADAGRKLAPGRFESWVSYRTRAERYYDKATGNLLAGHADADTMQWWFYQSGTGKLYRADLRPFADEARRSIAAFAKFHLATNAKQMLTENWSHVKQSVSTEQRNGHEVAVLTFAWEKDLPLNPPVHVTDRQVYTVDLNTDRWLTIRRYFKYPDGHEDLIEDTDLIEYDVPVPGDDELLAPAKEVHVVPATAALEEDGGVTYLVMKAEGRKINEGSAFTTMEVPKGK